MTKMSNKGKKINDAIDWLIVGAAIYFTTITIAGIAKWKRTHGVGKVERIKRRIYKEVSLAQDAGIDFTKKVDELNDRDRELLDSLGANAGWKQSKRSVESGKPYADAYYGSLRRAWNAVSGLGIRGIGHTYKVKDADGNTVLTWIEDAAAHVEAERRTLEAEKRAAESRRNLRKNRRERRNQTPVVVSPSVPEIVENYAEEDIQEPEPALTIQQQILQKVPYLKTLWREDQHSAGFESAVRDDFRYVVWIEVFNRTTGEKDFEGAKVATLTKAVADEIANEERRTVRFHDSEKNYNGSGYTVKLNPQKTRISVIPVEKVQVDRISGLFN